MSTSFEKKIDRLPTASESEPLSGTKSSNFKNKAEFFGPPVFRPTNNAEWEKLILNHLPVIRAIANSIAVKIPFHVSREILVNAGVIGLMDAVKKFDPKRKVLFKTYANYRIRGAILDELRSLDSVSRSVRSKTKELQRTRHEFEMKGFGEVDEMDVARAMNLSLDEYYSLADRMQNVSYPKFKNSPFPQSSDSEDGLSGLMHHYLEKTPAQELDQKEKEKTLASAIEALPCKEKMVISLYYYEELTLKEIGEVLGFTESRICQLHKQAVSKLKAWIRRHGDTALS